MATLPRTHKEFELLMEQIDEQLKTEGVPIHARASHAASEYSKLFKLEIPMSQDEPGAPGIYVGGSAWAHIRSWFNGRYGDRQKIYLGPGSTAIFLKGDPWEVTFPRTFGQIRWVVDRDLGRYQSHSSVSRGQPPTVNVLNTIKDFPDGLAVQLTDEECHAVFEVFQQSLSCMHAIEYIVRKPMVREALSDIHAATRHLFSVPPHYGQSKWSSAQAAEKLLKAYLTVKSIAFPFTHDLSALNKLTVASGMNAIEQEVIDLLQTPASARYGNHSVSSIEAVSAHHASLLIGYLVSEALLPEE